MSPSDPQSPKFFSAHDSSAQHHVLDAKEVSEGGIVRGT